MARARNNPYSFEPIKDAKNFAGRDKLILNVKNYLECSNSNNPTFYNFLIIGSQGSGKTSMLNLIKIFADERNSLVVDVPRLEVDSKISFLKKLFDATITAGAEKDLFGGKSGKIYRAIRAIMDNIQLGVDANIPFYFVNFFISAKKTENPEISLTDLRNDFEKIINELKKNNLTSITFFLDDTNILSHNQETNKQIIQAMSTIFNNLKGYHLIFAGKQDIIDDIKGFEPLIALTLSDLTSGEEVKEFVLKPLDNDQKKIVDEGVFDYILKLTHYHATPGLVTLFSHFMYKNYYENFNSERDFSSDKMEITQQVLEDVLSQLETKCIDPRNREEVKKLIAECIYWMMPKLIQNVPHKAGVAIAG
jgi:hypothetical protein